MKRSEVAGLIVTAGLTIAGCAASTTFRATWSEPGAQPINYQGKKLAALVMSSEMALRLSAEASLARELTARGANGVPAYTVVPEELIEDKDRARAFLERAGVAGVVVMRVVATDKEIVQTSGYWASGPYAPYGSFWGGYWGYGWGAVYNPGTMRTDTIVSVETLLYDLEQDKLIWAGQSQTTNPSKLDKFMHELVTKAAAEIRKAGLVRPQGD